MFEMLPASMGSTNNDNFEWAVEAPPVKGRSYRLQYLAAGTNAMSGMIGCHEFMVYDSQGRNMCRTAGFIPTLGWSRPLTQGPWFDPTIHGPDKTIDGNISAWQSTCYGQPNPEGKSLIQYNFTGDFVPVSWYFKCEGNYFPATGGVALQRLNAAGEWKTITGNPVNGNTWTNGTAKSWNIPAGLID